MAIIRTAIVIGALAYAGAAWAADTDVENPNLRELPLQRGAIYGGKQHQPTSGEVQERLQEKAQPPGPGAKPPARQGDPLYDRVLQQSQRSMPRTIDPDQ
jgi:hypothetical protein